MSTLARCCRLQFTVNRDQTNCNRIGRFPLHGVHVLGYKQHAVCHRWLLDVAIRVTVQCCRLLMMLVPSMTPLAPSTTPLAPSMTPFSPSVTTPSLMLVDSTTRYIRLSTVTAVVQVALGVFHPSTGQLCLDLAVDLHGPTVLRLDSKSAIDMAHDPVTFKKTKPHHA